jgi:hypothetical protein
VTVDFACAHRLQPGDEVVIGKLNEQPSRYRVVSVIGTKVEIEEVDDGAMCDISEDDE